MFVQFIVAVLGIMSVNSAVDASAKGFQNEEKYLEYRLSLEQWINEEKKTKHEIEVIEHRQHRPWGCRCVCEHSREEENKIDFLVGRCYHNIFAYSHWLRNKIVSAEVQKEELKSLIEKVKIILSVLKDTRQHSEEEEKFNQKTEEITDRQEYEFLNQEIIELTQEKEQWQNILNELEERLNHLG